ncbi:MAG: hypothetical protein HY711_07535 [Candidatus Melainabacteria bacterium]|nr:hypothetical protein [Candidatus Melainabacteria bacterium]
MNNGDASNMDFNPPNVGRPGEFICPVSVEESIVGTIIEGSGGAENGEFTDCGLRFVRYLLSISPSARHGFVPNLKDLGIIRRLARDFIHRCGGPAGAVQAMLEIAGSPTSP